jgi:hypothetical protein
MPPIPGIPLFLEPRQTTLDFTGQYIAKKPGPRPSPTTLIPIHRSTRAIELQFARESAYESILVYQF